MQPPSPSGPDYVAVISALISCFAAFMAYLSYKATVRQNKINQENNIVSNCHAFLDQCYDSTATFCNEYYASTGSADERIAREKILYMVERLRTDFNDINSKEFHSHSNDLQLGISDITYQNNFEKIVKDLESLRNVITLMKGLSPLKKL